MSKTKIQRYGIGFQILKFSYRDNKNNVGFKSAYAPLTIGYRKGKLTFLIKRVAPTPKPLKKDV